MLVEGSSVDGSTQYSGTSETRTRLKGMGPFIFRRGLQTILNQKGVNTSYRRLVSILVYFAKEGLSYDGNLLGELNQ